MKKLFKSASAQDFAGFIFYGEAMNQSFENNESFSAEEDTINGILEDPDAESPKLSIKSVLTISAENTTDLSTLPKEEQDQIKEIIKNELKGINIRSIDLKNVPVEIDENGNKVLAIPVHTDSSMSRETAISLVQMQNPKTTGNELAKKANKMQAEESRLGEMQTFNLALNS